MRLGRPGEAAEALEQALAEDRGNHDVSYALAEARQAMGEREQARQVAQDLIRVGSPLGPTLEAAAQG